MEKYEVFDHTADLGLAIYGQDLKDLFENAAFAMFDQIAELKNVEQRAVVEVREEAPNVEELLVGWLRELLFQHTSRDTIFCDFSVKDIDKAHVRGVAAGENIDPKRHRLKKEIKAVTYHELEVKKIDGKWQAKVIFDI